MSNSSKTFTHKDSAGELTLLLSDLQNPESLRTVMRLAYGDFHDIARGYARKEPPGCTLTPTALVNEACLRLLVEGSTLGPFDNRRHFFGVAARVMRRILVDRARRRNAQKRGGGWTRVDFSDAERIGFEQPIELLDFHAVLTRLHEFRPLWGEMAELRIFGGWSTLQAAGIVGIAPSTARRRWARAKDWLRRALTDLRAGSPAGGGQKSS